MRLQDSITIGNFGSFEIEAVYDYRIELSYENKHGLPVVDNVKVDKVELHIKRHQSTLKGNVRVDSVKTVRVVGLLDIPPWLWQLLTDNTVLEELNREVSGPDPDDQRDAQLEKEMNNE